MSRVVLDASALLALINNERGSSEVETHLSHAMMSSINVSEVATVLVRVGMPLEQCCNIINTLVPEQRRFDSEQAYQVAKLKKETATLGLSLGDCACLGLALLENVPVITCDKLWKKTKLPLQIALIR